MESKPEVTQKKQRKARLQRKENQYEGEQIGDNQSTSVCIWRPWVEAPGNSRQNSRFQPYSRPVDHAGPSLMRTFRHPVRLYWTKKAYDYLYEAGESLLRNFPVQATIQIVEDSDSDESEDDSEELNLEENHEEKM